jgi:hypothetical protein
VRAPEGVVSALAEPLWTAQDVARYLRKSIRWVYGEAGASDADRLPCLRIGASLRFEPEAVRSWARRGVAARSTPDARG